MALANGAALAHDKVDRGKYVIVGLCAPIMSDYFFQKRKFFVPFSVRLRARRALQKSK